MITFLFYLLMVVCLLLFQTILCNKILLYYNVFDLMMLFVVYLGLFRPLTESVVAVLCIGLIMDAVTGGPFGLYLTIFFWLYVGAKWGVQYFHAGSILLLPFILGVAVLFENAVILFALAVSGNAGMIPSKLVIRSVLIQTVWAMCVGPFFLLFCNFIKTKLNEWQSVRLLNRHELGG